ncbi:Pv-fam-d protein, partial [Plasmodium cynomolgi strain B]
MDEDNEEMFPYDHENSSTSMESEHDSEIPYPPQNYDDDFNGPYNSFDVDENYEEQYNRPIDGDYPDQQFNASKQYGLYVPNLNDSKRQNGYIPQRIPNVIVLPERHLDMMIGRGHYLQEAFDEMEPDDRQKTGESLMREEYEKAKTSIEQEAEKRTPFGNIINRIDTRFEYEMMRSMKARNNDNSAVKEKGMRSNLIFYMKKYKLLFPLMCNLLAVGLLVMMGFEVTAIILCIIGIMLVVYYELKLSKIKKMHRVFKKFNARYHILP